MDIKVDADLEPKGEGKKRFSAFLIVDALVRSKTSDFLIPMGRCMMIDKSVDTSDCPALVEEKKKLVITMSQSRVVLFGKLFSLFRN